MSGTSMAAPYVTNIAGLVKDENAKLAPKDIKEILMGTVDAKPWLSGKVKTGGIVNKDRAVIAARLTLTHTVSEAITMSKAKVDDMAPTAIDFRRSADGDIVVLPLPSTL
jgi:subtilisin family serine protease